MKLGVFSVLLGDRSLADTLDYFKSIGVEAIELGCGGYPGTAHANPEKLLNDSAAYDSFMSTIKNSGIMVAALSVHGNAVHPQKDIADKFHKDFELTVRLAEKMGIETVITFSGCPGDHAGAKYPNWVTCPWPEDFLAVLEYQWNDVLIPYWKKAAAFAKEHGIKKIALEMHPGFAVYNPHSLLKLRAAVGDIIGANFDPSHLIWQGMDPVAAIRALKGCIFHFHAKDTRIDKYNCAINGVLDTRHYSDEANRSWVFRTVGYGTDEALWRDMFSELVMAGYDHVVSIEHEDSLMTTTEGLEKAVKFLKNVMIHDDKPKEMHWA